MHTEGFSSISANADDYKTVCICLTQTARIDIRIFDVGIHDISAKGLLKCYCVHVSTFCPKQDMQSTSLLN